jgi:hypothetical protein
MKKKKLWVTMTMIVAGGISILVYLVTNGFIPLIVTAVLETTAVILIITEVVKRTSIEDIRRKR